MAPLEPRSLRHIDILALVRVRLVQVIKRKPTIREHDHLHVTITQKRPLERHTKPGMVPHGKGENLAEMQLVEIFHDFDRICALRKLWQDAVSGFWQDKLVGW